MLRVVICKYVNTINLKIGKVMKETVGSLKAYFIVVAVLGGLGSVPLLGAGAINPLFPILGLVGLAFCCAYFYIGIMLRKLLLESPQLVNKVILASMVYQVLNFLLSLTGGLQLSAIFQLIIGLLLTWYLLNSVKRLSQEERAKTRVE